MAAFYIEEVRKKQAHGPYLLGGLCAGAVIAYEMASQLVRAGESVELLALLDAATPNARERSAMKQRQERLKQALAEVQKNERLRLRRGSLIVRTLWRKALSALVWEISHRTKRVSVRARFRLLRNLLRYDLAWPKFLPQLSVRDIYDCAQARFEPKPLTVSSVLLVRARTADPDVADDTPYQDIYADRTLGWGTVARGLKVVDVDGGHSSMLQESYVDSLAEVLMAYVQEERSIHAPSLEVAIA
jgi:thioesterase domain-containing protein